MPPKTSVLVYLPETPVKDVPVKTKPGHTDGQVLLLKVRRYLTEHRWTQRTMWDGNDGYCLVGVVMQLSKVQPGYEEAVNRLALSLPLDVVLRFDTQNNLSYACQSITRSEKILMWWNDSIAESKKQVVDLITHAYQRDMSRW